MLNLEAILSNQYVLESPLEQRESVQLYKIKSTTRNRYETLVIVDKKALKIENESAVQDFEGRFRNLSNLNHPSLPNVVESFRDKEHYFFITSVLLENTLTTLLENAGRPLAFTDVFEWSVQLLNAVEYLHKNDIVHRDIKPDNILITTEGRVLIADFSVAQVTTPPNSHSGYLQHYKNTYSAPEILYGKFDNTSDLYSLAAVIYHMITGVKPPDAQTRSLSTEAGLIDPLRSASEVNPQVPASVARILRKCLEISPSQRPATANLMRLELERAFETIAQEQILSNPMASENSPDLTIERMRSFPQRKATLLEMTGAFRKADSR